MMMVVSAECARSWFLDHEEIVEMNECEWKIKEN
jgi:hypothetical protein